MFNKVYFLINMYKYLCIFLLKQYFINISQYNYMPHFFGCDFTTTGCEVILHGFQVISYSGPVTLMVPMVLTLNAPITTKVVCFSRLLKCLRSLYGKQCGPRSDCSYRSSLFWVHVVCFYTSFVSNVRQLFAADDFSRRHFQMHFYIYI